MMLTTTTTMMMIMKREERETNLEILDETRRRTLESASFGFEFYDIGDLELNILDLDDLIHLYVLTCNVHDLWLLALLSSHCSSILLVQ